MRRPIRMKVSLSILSLRDDAVFMTITNLRGSIHGFSVRLYRSARSALSFVRSTTTPRLIFKHLS